MQIEAASAPKLPVRHRTGSLLFEAMYTAVYSQHDRSKPLSRSSGPMGLIWLPDIRRSGRFGATDGEVVLFLDPDESGWRLTCDPLFHGRRLLSDTLDEARHEAERLVSGAYQATLSLAALD
jgi:hypothetical protein